MIAHQSGPAGYPTHPEHVWCPKCETSPGTECKTAKGGRASDYHRERYAELCATLATLSAATPQDGAPECVNDPHDSPQGAEAIVLALKFIHEAGGISAAQRFLRAASQALLAVEQED